MSVIVFTSNSCSNCTNMKAILTHMLGDKYSERNVDNDPEALAVLSAQGFRTVPVVQIGEEFFPHNKMRDIEKRIDALKAL